VYLYSLAFAYGVDLFMGFSFDIDAIQGRAHEASEVGPHRVLVRTELGTFENHRGVYIADAPARFGYKPHGGGQKVRRIAGFVPGVGIGEELSDVGFGQGAQKGVGDRVIQSVAIGMADRPVGVGQDYTAQYQNPARTEGGLNFQSVEVVPMTDPEGGVAGLGGVGGRGHRRCYARFGASSVRARRP
jgi:hypothetical protein